MSILSNILKRNFVTNFNRGDESFARIGRFYEEKCKEVISKLFEVPVKLVGGANDGGVDLIWSQTARSPIEKEEVPFIGQCKYVQKSVKLDVIRALNGTVSNWPKGTVGCLITNNRPSPNLLNEFQTSQYPLMFFQISGCDVNCKATNLILLNHKFMQLYPNVQVVLVRGSIPPQFILRFN